MPIDKGLGWRRQTPDFRDFRYSVPPRVLRTLPPAIDLRAQMPAPVWDQGQLGSCTSHALCAAFVYAMAHVQTPSAAPPAFDPSRLFHYYCERAMEGTVASDAGAELRDGAKALATVGVCASDVWPYDPHVFDAKPPDAAYAEAIKHEALVYAAVPQDLAALRGALADGFPFVFGIAVYASFMSDEVAKTGIVPLPSPTEAMEGGHALICVGYDDAHNMFTVRNSWGEWGDKGHCYIPYSYLIDPNLGSDFWIIRTVT